MVLRRIPVVLRAALACLLLLAAPLYADIESVVGQVLRDKYLDKAHVAVVIARLDGSGEPQMLVRHNPSDPLIPASNLKLVTTAASLDHFGADHKLRTVLLQNGPDVVLVGDGDPTFGDVELLKASGWDVATVYALWADEMRRRGIDSVRDIVVDDSVFDQEFLHPNWPADQVHKRYEAQVGGLNLNANCLDFYLSPTTPGKTVRYTMVPQTGYASVRNSCLTGNRSAVWLSRDPGGNQIVLRGEADVANTEPISVTIHDPPMFAGFVLVETLRSRGISVTGTLRRDLAAQSRDKAQGAAGGWTVLGALETPITGVLGRANKDSMNLYAEALCKRLGHATSGEPGSWANGTAAMAAFLRSCKVSPQQFVLDDGCGLSKRNAISAEALVRVLAHVYARPDAQAYFSTLAVGGMDGTLEDRFRQSALVGRVFAKSGYVNRVSALSGYLKAADGQWYAFSILMNDLPQGTNAKAKQVQERILTAVDAELASQPATRAR
jgi:D-alanyl-D-alanine carboxypeptidase/D-alanyl-D-alanine-endopeptidase (penicillin-binding protein 4)